MKLEAIKRHVASGIIVICTGAFTLVARSVAAGHIFLMPFLEPHLPHTSMVWIEAGIDAPFVLTVGPDHKLAGIGRINGETTFPAVSGGVNRACYG